MTKTKGDYSASFVSSYRGEAEYIIWRGAVLVGRLVVRSFAGDDGKWNGDTYAREIEPMTGCARWAGQPASFEFPPSEVLALFPGYVGARWVEGFTIETTAPRDVLKVRADVCARRGVQAETWSAAHVAQCADYTTVNRDDFAA